MTKLLNMTVTITPPVARLGETAPDSELVALLEGYSEPAILLTPNYRIVAANGAYRKTYGAGEDPRGRLCHSVSHGNDLSCDQAGEDCPLIESRRSGKPQRVLHIHHTPRGDEHVDVEIRPVGDGKGHIRYFLEIMRGARNVSARPSVRGLVGRSPAFIHMLELMQRVGPTEVTTLLLGESGTGKEEVARAIHRLSPRAGGAFVPVECSGLTETLFESELFGHEKGAFTGALSTHIGLVEAARGGTLFLDEIGDIPLQLQVKLLRLLETGTFRRVGSARTQQADFRLVCATHRNLSEMVRRGDFRQDLFYRINIFAIELPPLRDRPEDIPLLSETLLQRLPTGRDLGISREALNILSRYEFPGNVRELRNILERASLLTDCGTIQPKDLPTACIGVAPSPRVSAEAEDIVTLAEQERAYLHRAQRLHQGDRRSLAKKLGISERTLFRKLQALKLAP